VLKSCFKLVPVSVRSRAWNQELWNRNSNFGLRLQSRGGHESGVDSCRILRVISEPEPKFCEKPDPDPVLISSNSRSLRGLYERHCTNIAECRLHRRLSEFEQESDSQNLKKRRSRIGIQEFLKKVGVWKCDAGRLCSTVLLRITISDWVGGYHETFACTTPLIPCMLRWNARKQKANWCPKFPKRLPCSSFSLKVFFRLYY